MTEDCEHVLYPHAHGWQPDTLRRCSGKYWCTQCKEWLVREKCSFGKKK